MEEKDFLRDIAIDLRKALDLANVDALEAREGLAVTISRIYERLPKLAKNKKGEQKWRGSLTKLPLTATKSRT